MPKFTVKNSFYWRGALMNPGDVIDVPQRAVAELRRKNVLGEPVKKKPEKATEPAAKEKAEKPAPKRRTNKKD